MAHNHDDDPALAEAIARRDESRAQILRSKAQGDGAYAKLANKAEAEAKKSTSAAASSEPGEKDLSGTAQTLSDSAGNFAANPQVAATGGIGIDASNTDVSTGKPAQTPEQAGVAAQPGAQKIVGDQAIGGAGRPRTAETDETRATVVIVDGWRDLSWQERRSIASKLSNTPISNGEEANAAIETELKRQGRVMGRIKGVVTPRKVNELAAELEERPADAVTVEEGDDGLEVGTLQEVLQSLASRIQVLEDAAE